MKTPDSKQRNVKLGKKPVLRAAAYGLALASVLIARLVKTCEKCLVEAATANSTERDTPPICKNSRERFVWTHGFISGFGIAAVVFTVGLCIVLWVTLQ